MAIDIEIKQRGMYRKPLTEAHLSMDGLRIGHWNHAGVLDPEPDSTGRVLCDPLQPGRGCYIQAAPGEKQQARLRQPLPCTPRDLEVLYSFVRRICQAWGTARFIQDGEECRVSDIPQLIEAQRKADVDLLRSMARRWAEDGMGLITGAVYPIYMEPEVVQRLAEAEDLDYFQQYLAQKQQGNWYYAKPNFYRLENGAGTLGVYSITEGVGSILPMKAFVPPLYSVVLHDFQVTDEQVTEWRVALCRVWEENGQLTGKTLGYIPFAQFAQKVKLDQCPRFDVNHVYVQVDDLSKLLDLQQD